MSMDINEFKEKFTKEQLQAVVKCKRMKDVFDYVAAQNIQLDEEEENILANVYGETKVRPEGHIEVDANFADRFKVFSHICDDYVVRKYASDDVWEEGYDPRSGPREIQKECCMNCDKARVKQYYCLCTK